MCYNKAILCREVSSMEQVEATVRETIYRNEENGYSVVQCKATAGDSPPWAPCPCSPVGNGSPFPENGRSIRNMARSSG